MNTKCGFSNDALSGVERATELVQAFFQASRGRHANDDQTVRDIAQRARISPAEVRKFLQPSRRPKDVSFSVWCRLSGAYARYLRQQLHVLEMEIARLDHLDPDDRALRHLLDDAEGLVRNIKAAAASDEPGEAQE